MTNSKKEKEATVFRLTILEIGITTVKYCAQQYFVFRMFLIKILNTVVPWDTNAPIYEFF